MKISSRELISLPVYTKSNTFLGKVFSFEVDTESHQIINYIVRAGNLASRLLVEEKDLVISREQVISLTEEKMIVDDLVEKQTTEQKKEDLIKSKETVGVMPLEN